MSSRWEGIVGIARDVDSSFASGKEPDFDLVTRLARAVLDFQQHLTDMRAALQSRAAARPERPPSAAE